MVNLPAPARYAVHKLLIMGERSDRFRSKVSKDLLQAESLIEFFAAHDPSAIRTAWNDAMSRGPGWRKRGHEGRRALATRAPDLAKLLKT